MAAVLDNGTVLRALDGRGEGKLRPVEAPTVLALLPGMLPAGSSRTRLASLAAEARWDMAVPFLAHALPVREAVWWACMCVRWAVPAADEHGQAALAAAEAWVRLGSMATRQACLLAAKQAGAGRATAAVAFAAHGAHLSTMHSPLGNQWVATALKRALSPCDTAAYAEMAARFVESGCDVAAGGAGRFQPATFQPAAT